jgi:hypothetical protein
MKQNNIMEENINYGFNKLYPNAVNKNTSDSETVIRMKQISGNKQKAIEFYCGKRHQYIFIERTIQKI